MIDNSATTDRHEMVRLQKREIRRMAQEALHVQDACNLSGVLHSAAKNASSLRTTLNISTLEVNQHFVMQLFACKIADLAGVGCSYPKQAEADAVAFCAAYDTEGNRA